MVSKILGSLTDSKEKKKITLSILMLNVSKLNKKNVNYESLLETIQVSFKLVKDNLNIKC